MVRKIDFNDYKINLELQLKLCPFCKSRATFDSSRRGGTGSSGMEAPIWRVKCTKCWASTPYQDGDMFIIGTGMINIERQALGESFKLWNNRA